MLAEVVANFAEWWMKLEKIGAGNGCTEVRKYQGARLATPPTLSGKTQKAQTKFLDVAAQSAPKILQWVSICYRMFGWTLLYKRTDAE
jgi:hypothetical protein